MNLHYYILRTRVALLMLVAAHTLGAQCAVSLNASISPGGPQSCNGTDGVLTITFSNGTAPYQYTLQHNGVPLLTNVTSDNEVIYTDLASGLYQISVTDLVGCTSDNAVTLTTTPSISLALSTSVSNLPPGVCNGANGILTMNATGTPPFDFAYRRITPPPGSTMLVTSTQNTVDVPDLPPGNYSVTVTDNFWFCSATSTIVVANTPLLTVTLNPTNPSCGQNNGSITSTVSGGTPPYSYLWSNGSTTPQISGQSPGADTLTVTDANGCTASRGVSLISSDPVVSIAGANNTACEGTPMSFTGVSPGINTWFWTDGTVIYVGQNLSFIASPPGVYTYTVTAVNASGCTGTASVSLTVLPSPTATITGNTTTCIGGSTVLTAGGGSTYLWSTGETTAEITVNPSTVTTYAMTVSNGGWCSSSTFIVVQPVVSAIVEVINDNCDQGSSGSINLTAFGGLLPHTYLWNNGETTANLIGVPAGTYTVTVTEAAGCTNSASGTVGAAMLLNTLVSNVDCFGGASGSIALSVTGGIPPYTYTWSNGSTTEDLSNLSAGIYTVTVTDFNNCTQFLPVSVLQPDSISIDLIGILVNCNGQGEITISVSGGVAPYTYLWAGPNGFLSTSQNISGLQAGIYSVLVIDATGCFKTLMFNTGIPLLLSTSISVTNAVCAGSNGAIDVTVLNGSGNYQYVWSNGITTEDLNNVIPGAYTITITDMVSGCIVLDTAIVQTIADITINGGGSTVSCGNFADGVIDITVSGLAPPFEFLWSTGVTTEDLANLAPGIYTVTVTDLNGCFKAQSFSVLAPSNFHTLYTTQNPACSGDNTGGIAPTVFGTTPPYIFDWAHIPGSNDPQTLSGLSAGVYQVTITDVEGCTNDTTIILSAPQPVVLNIVAEQSCGSTTISITSTTGGLPPYTYQWNNGVNSNINVAYSSGVFSVTVIDANGCIATQSIIAEVVPGNNCSYFSGKVVIDANLNCVNDAETGLGQWIVRATGNQTFYALTDVDGNYHIGVAPGENYMIEAIPPGSLWAPCPPAFLVAPVTPDTITGVDLPIEQIVLCPEMEVNLYSGNIRRCFSNNHYSISYCNNGTALAEDAYIILSMDALSSPVSSNLPYINLGNNNFRFNIGDVAIGECNTISVLFAVGCDAVVGQTVCATAHIYPDSICLPPNAQWSGASLAISSQCEADSLHFTLKNIGFGPMSQALEYIVVEDHVMLFSLPVQLDPNETKIVAVPSNGSTWRLAVPQEPFHPGNSQPSLTVEGCTTNSTFSTGFVNQFTQNEADPWIDIWCAQITAAFDPNDKQGFPTGYGNEHYIEPGVQLEYGIRFQNTGNDTAFTVRLVDTLSQWLDPATIRPGSASHPYTFDLTGTGIATFTFDNILLPDSNVNEAASHGFVKFTISPKNNIPLETVINNTAAIYFDFNAPIYTNTTFHKIGDHFLTVGLWQPENPDYEVLVSPNPSSGNTVITVRGPVALGSMQLQVLDMYGRVVLNQLSSGDTFRLNTPSLPSGMYAFRIVQDGKMVGKGKMLVAR